MKRFDVAWVLAVGLFEAGCIALPGEIGELPGEGSTTDGSGSGSGSDGVSASGPGDTADGSSGGGGGPANSECGPDGPSCVEDQDRDCVGISEDNDPGVHNPTQSDLDSDGLVDEVDSCPSVPSGFGDSDDDGLGNECDPCRRPPAQYNLDAAAPAGYMVVRNVPGVGDADGDGIGDACDNCVVTPNCEAYGPGNEWAPGDPIAYDDEGLCQLDANDDMVGDACEGLTLLPGAAGPVGLGPDDDFDQDGLHNIIDACPRLPLSDAIPCANDGECPLSRRCETSVGLCDHVDTDSDTVGDACDSCSTVPNPLQVADGAMQEGDDLDGDFVGNACEGHSECETITSPARVGFYPVAVEGWCCTVQYPGDGVLYDPNGFPINLGCDETSSMCRQVPPHLANLPGLIALPPGCEVALADAGLTVETHAPLAPGDVGGVEGLWSHSCRLPPLDQDFDGLSDSCDLCEFDFDPTNAVYIDAMGQVWPNDGRYCNGEYSLENTCPV